MANVMVPRNIIEDENIHVISKAIYFLFASRAKKDGRVSIQRKEIWEILQLAKRTYYVYLNPLLDNGYIVRLEQPNHEKGFEASLYCLPSQPSQSRRIDDSILYAGLHARDVGTYLHFRGVIQQKYPKTMQITTCSQVFKQLPPHYKRRIKTLAGAGFIQRKRLKHGWLITVSHPAKPQRER